MTAIDAAIILGVTRRTVYRWVACGRLSWPITLDPLSLPTPRRRGPQRSPWSVRYTRGRHTFRAEGRLG